MVGNDKIGLYATPIRKEVGWDKSLVCLGNVTGSAAIKEGSVGRILLVEDSRDSQVLVRRALEDSAELTIAETQQGALDLLRENDFDLLIVDVQLPDGNGFGLCSTLLADQKSHRPRILFLTGKGELADKLTGFSVGGDDYLVKPIDPLELRARVQAQLRQCRETLLQMNVLKAGNLRLDISTHRSSVAKNGETKDVDLTPMEFKLLYQMARHEGQVFSREQLLQAVKGGSVHVTDRTIDAHLCRLRKKLSGCTHNVEPIYGIGYRFTRKSVA
jgi:DNA-binding response OmpR family regulator